MNITKLSLICNRVVRSFLFIFYYIKYFIGGINISDSPCAEVRRKPLETILLPACGSWELNSHHQSKVPLHTESSYWPKGCILMTIAWFDFCSLGCLVSSEYLFLCLVTPWSLRAWSLYTSDHETGKWIVRHISHTKCSDLLIVMMNLDLSPRASLIEEALTSPSRKKSIWILMEAH